MQTSTLKTDKPFWWQNVAKTQKLVHFCSSTWKSFIIKSDLIFLILHSGALFQSWELLSNFITIYNHVVPPKHYCRSLQTSTLPCQRPQQNFHFCLSIIKMWKITNVELLKMTNHYYHIIMGTLIFFSRNTQEIKANFQIPFCN